MKPAPFTYHRPRTREEVDDLLTEYGNEAKLLAGGQSLVPMLNMRLTTPRHLIDINGLEDEPSAPGAEPGCVTMGPLVRHTAVLNCSHVGERLPLLHEALRLVAHPPIRNRGTFVGAIAHADPSSELPPAFMLLGGQLSVRRRGERRVVPASAAFDGPFEPAIAVDEWIDGISFAETPPGGFALDEFARRDADYAICGLAARVVAEDGGHRAQLVYFSVGELAEVIELPVLEAGEIRGTGFDAIVGELVSSRLDPPGDIHATPAFRLHVARRLTVTTVRRALARAGDAG